MTKISTALLMLMAVAAACKTDKNPAAMQAEMPESGALSVYDSALAARYGADEYGMKKYVMAFLKRGPNQDMDSAQAAALQAAHLQNIGRMASMGKLVLAGPFFEDGELRGIYVFNVATLAEAEELTNSDPAVQAGRLVMELKEWYGSAALMGLADIDEKLRKKSILD